MWKVVRWFETLDIEIKILLVSAFTSERQKLDAEELSSCKVVDFYLNLISF